MSVPIFNKDDREELEKHGLTPIRPIGSGGYGEAILCTDTNASNAQRQVVVKIVKFRDDEEKEQFRNEPKILEKLNHENVCHYYRHWEIEYYGAYKLYIVMEDCGTSLSKMMQDSLYKGDFDAVFRIYFDSLTAMAYIHEQKIIHRDISPENIAVREGKPKILDFGVSCEFHTNLPFERTPSCGKDAYMAPEIRGLYTERVDVFSLGVLFYELYLSAVLNGFHNLDYDKQTSILKILIERAGKVPAEYRNRIPLHSPLTEDLLDRLLERMVVEQSKRWSAAQLRSLCEQ